MNRWEILYDDSGESEYYGEGNWFIANVLGTVLDDKSFSTKKEAEEYLRKLGENHEQQ
jgi:hypothetical protein